MVLIEVQLLETKVYHVLRKIPKAKTRHTSARTSTNAIYTPLLMQASLGMMSGILQSEGKDYKTGYSYFYEAFEGFADQEYPRALTVLKDLFLSKIMLNLSDDIV